METVADFIFLSSKITADGDYNHEIKRCLLLGRKAMTNLDSILKSRNITSLTNVHLVKATVFPVVWMWELDHKESWAPKNWCFWTVVLEKILRIPWTARRSNLSILKEISPEYWLEGLMLKLKLQYFGHLMWRTDSLEKTLVLGKIESRRRRGCRKWDGWMPSLAWWTWVWASSGSWWWTGKPGMLQSMGLQTVGHNWVTELNWTDKVESGIYPWDARIVQHIQSLMLYITLTERRIKIVWPIQ